VSLAIFRFHSFTSPSALTLKIGAFAPSIILRHKEELGPDIAVRRERLVDVPTQDLGGAGKGLAPFCSTPNVPIYNKASNSQRRGPANRGCTRHCVSHKRWAVLAAVVHSEAAVLPHGVTYGASDC
jgi:hypothetical protein